MFGSLSPALLAALTAQGQAPQPNPFPVAPDGSDPLSPLAAPTAPPAPVAPPAVDTPTSVNDGINSVGRPSDSQTKADVALKRLHRESQGQALLALGAELLGGRNFGEGLSKGILAYQQTLRSLRPTSKTVGDGEYEAVTDPLTGQVTYRATPIHADKMNDRRKPVVSGYHVYQYGTSPTGAYDGSVKDLAPPQLEPKVLKDAAGNETIVFVNNDTGEVFDAKGSKLSGPTNSAVSPGPGNVAPAPPPADPSRIAAITASSESNNRDMNADGSPVTSNKGAKFAMQVLPSTAHNPGYGIAPAASDTPTEYNRVGTQLLQKLQGKYGGDLAKGWAAYNWGPTRVDRDVATNQGDWFAHLPASVQNYVKKNMAALGQSPPTTAGAQVADNAPLQPPSQDPNEAQAPTNLWGLQPHDFTAAHAPSIRFLSATEKAAAGYPADAVIQRDARGLDHVMEKGTPADQKVPDSAIDVEATKFNRTGQMTAMGMGNPAIRDKIIARAAQQVHDLGIDPNDLNAMQADYKADVATRTDRNRQLSVTNTAIKAAIAHGHDALAWAAKIPGQTNVKLWNYVSQGILDQNSNPALYALQGSAKIAEAEVAKAITGNPTSGAGQLTDEARKEFRIIEGPAGLDAKRQAWATIEQMMNQKAQAVQDEVSRLDQRMHGPLTNYATPGGASSRNTNPTGNRRILRTGTAKDGRKVAQYSDGTYGYLSN